jgi:hypothetical protein
MTLPGNYIFTIDFLLSFRRRGIKAAVAICGPKNVDLELFAEESFRGIIRTMRNTDTVN